MTKEQLKCLERGDIVRNLGSGNSYIITDNCGSYAIAITTVTVTNPNEWELIKWPTGKK